MGNWKEELLQLAPIVSLAAGAWLAIMIWLIARLRNRRAARTRAAQQGPWAEAVENPAQRWPSLYACLSPQERLEFAQATPDEQVRMFERAARAANAAPVVLEGTLLGNMLAITVVSVGRGADLPGPIWDIYVGSRAYSVQLMRVASSETGGGVVVELDQSSGVPAEFRTGVFSHQLTSTAYVQEVDNRKWGPEMDAAFPTVDLGPHYILTQTTAFVVSGVTDENAEDVVAALQQELNGFR